MNHAAANHKIGRGKALTRRIFLPEIQDMRWCPRSLRDAINDSIQFGLNFLEAYKAAVPLLKSALDNTGDRNVIDLGSGGGGPWVTILPLINDDDLPGVTVTLTDKYPNPLSFEMVRRQLRGKADYYTASVDACHVPENLIGFRTMFGAFHHLRNTEASRALGDAIARNQGIGVFELTNRLPQSFLLALIFPIFMLLASPFIRPFRFSRLLWTYLPPLGPLVGCIDGIISCLRTFTSRQEEELISEYSSADYDWRYGKVRATPWPLFITYLIGFPSGGKNGESKLMAVPSIRRKA